MEIYNPPGESNSEVPSDAPDRCVLSTEHIHSTGSGIEPSYGPELLIVQGAHLDSSGFASLESMQSFTGRHAAGLVVQLMVLLEQHEVDPVLENAHDVSDRLRTLDVCLEVIRHSEQEFDWFDSFAGIEQGARQFSGVETYLYNSDRDELCRRDLLPLQRAAVPLRYRLLDLHAAIVDEVNSGQVVVSKQDGALERRERTTQLAAGTGQCIATLHELGNFNRREAQTRSLANHAAVQLSSVLQEMEILRILYGWTDIPNPFPPVEPVLGTFQVFLQFVVSSDDAALGPTDWIQLKQESLRVGRHLEQVRRATSEYPRSAEVG